MKMLQIGLLFSLVGFIACSPKVLSYYNPDVARHKEYQTYRLLNTKLERTNLSKDGRAILDVVELALRNQMNKRGYEESNLSPDLVLRYEIATNQRTQSNNNNSLFWAPVTTSTFMESLIIIDLTDTDRKKMFWQGSFDMRQETRDLKQEQATELAISEIFYLYPYRSGDATPDAKLADAKAGRKALNAKHKQEKKEAKSKKKDFKKNL